MTEDEKRSQLKKAIILIGLIGLIGSHQENGCVLI